MDIDALLAEHLEPARRELERSKVLYEQMQSGEITVETPDRTVRLTQTCAGETISIEISPGAFEKHNERAFATMLTGALNAARKAARQAAEQLADEVMREREMQRGR